MSEKQEVATSTIEYVPYGRLQRSPLNERNKVPTSIDTLAETIIKKGLQTARIRSTRSPAHLKWT